VDLIIRHNGKGRDGYDRGVYTARRFQRGELISECPMLVWPRNVAADRFIGNYLWSWADDAGRRYAREALCLGIASLFNHSPRPNTGIRRLYDRDRMTFRALRRIEKGEEILIDYGVGAGHFEVRT